MDWQTIIQAFSATTILWALAVFLGKELIKRWIDMRVRISGEKDFESFRAELNAEKATISAIRDTVLSGRSNRQALIDQRRLDAIDIIWLSSRSCDKYLIIAKSLESINLDYACLEIGNNPKI